MKRARLLVVATAALLGGCGRVGDLKPAAGQSLPVKPLMARTTPDASALLTPPPYAKPERIDELMKKSEPRKPDPPKPPKVDPPKVDPPKVDPPKVVPIKPACKTTGVQIGNCAAASPFDPPKK